VEERGELGKTGSSPTGSDAHFSTIHRPYYDYNQNFRTAVLRRAQ
jgi:hypothetical protein